MKLDRLIIRGSRMQLMNVGGIELLMVKDGTLSMSHRTQKTVSATTTMTNIAKKILRAVERGSALSSTDAEGSSVGSSSKLKSPE